MSPGHKGEYEDFADDDSRSVGMSTNEMMDLLDMSPTRGLSDSAMDMDEDIAQLLSAGP
jgi:ADP-dependent phosphofructokinase/glucokinase